MGTQIVSGFPGVGKTSLANHPRQWHIQDSDSSVFSWSAQGIRNPEFPANYMNHIKGIPRSIDIICVSSHAVVRQALATEQILYTLVYPELQLKEEYLQRYRDRGSTESFITLMETNWEQFLNELDAETWSHKIVLHSGQGLSDVIDLIRDES